MSNMPDNVSCGKTTLSQLILYLNAGLVDSDTSEPNPDFYTTLLWRRLMGEGAIGYVAVAVAATGRVLRVSNQRRGRIKKQVGNL